jgi:hypothetical protein
MTTFDLPGAHYAAARNAFVEMKDKVTNKSRIIKKELDAKWDATTGKKS